MIFIWDFPIPFSFFFSRNSTNILFFGPSKFVFHGAYINTLLIHSSCVSVCLCELLFLATRRNFCA